MKHIIAAAALAACCLAGPMGCRENPEQMMQTAQFEEIQRNYPHAREIYQRIVRDHPDSPQAKQAAERLQALPE